MNPTIDAYAAGLFDGEGNVGAGQTRGAWTIACHVGMTIKAKATLEGLEREYGGRIRLHRAATAKWAEVWTWSVHGREAAAFLSRVLPYLKVKRDVAETALRLEGVRLALDTMTPTTQRRRWTPEASERCAALHREIKRLNRLGPEPKGSTKALALLVEGRWMSPQFDLFTDTGWAPFSGRWPAWGMTRGGELFELPTPALPTDAPGSSSLLPTPEAKLSDSGPDYARANREGSGGDDLTTTIHRHLLPTPAVNDMGAGKTVEAWDEWTEKMRSKHGNGNGHGPSLSIEALRLGDSTPPQSPDGKPSSDAPPRPQRSRRARTAGDGYPPAPSNG